MSWVLDLDGVVWRGDTQVEGAPEAIADLQARGIDVFYATNNSAKKASAYVDKLRSLGVAVEEEAIVHGGHAIATLTKPGDRVLVCAGDGVVEGLQANDVEVIKASSVGITPPPVDAVVIAWTPDFDYQRLTLATRAALNGARLLATNMDPIYPTSDGFAPGTGALATAVAFASGSEITFSGKPLPPMTEIVRRKAGAVDVVVGDQPRTDGGLALALGAAFLLVLTGVTGKDAEIGEVPVELVETDLRSAVESWFAR